MENLNPKLHGKVESRSVTLGETDERQVDEIDAREVFGKLRKVSEFHFTFTLDFIALTRGSREHLRLFQFINCNFADLIRDINDPEHPLTLEDLNVVQLERITVSGLSSHPIWLQVGENLIQNKLSLI